MTLTPRKVASTSPFNKPTTPVRGCSPPASAVVRTEVRSARRLSSGKEAGPPSVHKEGVRATLPCLTRFALRENPFALSKAVQTETQTNRTTSSPRWPSVAECRLMPAASSGHRLDVSSGGQYSKSALQILILKQWLPPEEPWRTGLVTGAWSERR